MKVSIVHSHPPTAELLVKAISVKLNYAATAFSCIENLLASSMDYEVFIVYNNFGHKMSGIRGMTKIREEKPQALIIGVSYRPYLAQQFLPAGADAFILRAGNEIEEMVRVIRDHPKVRALAQPAQHDDASVQPPSPSVAKFLLLDKRKLNPAQAQALEKLVSQLKANRKIDPTAPKLFVEE